VAIPTLTAFFIRIYFGSHNFQFSEKVGKNRRFR
jgi:hypothetical protein